MATEQPGTVEERRDFGDDAEAGPRRWLAEIRAYEKKFGPWERRAQKIVQRYRDEALSGEESDDDVTSRGHPRRFNILWSNVQTLQPALLAKAPRVRVRRRNRDRDPVALAAAEILQRAVTYEQEACGYEAEFYAVRDDYLLPGRGTLWVRYVPAFGEERRADLELTPGEDDAYRGPDGAVVAPEAAARGPDGAAYLPGAGPAYRPVIDERAYLDYVHWKDFGHTVAPTWRKVTAVWRRELLTREQLVERFGPAVGREVSLTKLAAGVEPAVAEGFGDVFRRGEVYEIWDAPARRVYWVSPGYPRYLDQRDDPLNLEDFFPCPPPLYATTTTNSLVPVPDYVQYQAQALELDNLTQRIERLTAAVRVTGAYDSAFPQLEKILKNAENELVAVDNWAMFAEKGGIAGAISFVPIKEVMDVLFRLITVRNQVKQDLYELTGLSDLVRGQGRPSATATAERIKGQFITMRLEDRKVQIAKFLRNSLALVAEVMAEHFSPDILLQASGWLDTPNARAIEARQPGAAALVARRAIEVLRDEKLRGFRLEIETDSTVFENVQEEKKTRVEFLTAVSQYLQQAIPAAEQYPAVRPLLGELLMYGVRAFGQGRELEEVFEQTVEAMGQQQPGAKPEDQAAAQEAQGKMAEVQARAQEAQGKLALAGQELQLKQADQQFEQQLAVRKLEGEEAARAHERTMAVAELQLRQLELRAKLEELAARHEETSQRHSTELARISRSVADRAEDRANALADRVEDRANALEDRRLDRKMTPTLEEEVRTGNELLEKLSELSAQFIEFQTEVVKKQEEQTAMLVKVMTAPRKLTRDARGRPDGVAIETTVH